MELVVFLLGGLSYGFIEIIYRDHTHWTMFLTGGAVILTIYLLLPILMQQSLIACALIGTLIITIYEFSVGLLVNVYFNWNVWDYSNQPGNVMGQICPLFSAYWFAICLVFFALIKYNKDIFT